MKTIPIHQRRPQLLIRGGSNHRAVEFANDTLPDSGGGYQPGQVLFSNASRFVETYFSEPLTNYAVGWRDPNDIEGTLNFIAPPVPVGRRFEWKAAVNSEEFLSEVIDDQRAIGSDFKQVRYTGSDVVDKTLNKGLTYIADLDAVNENDPQWQNNKVAKLTRRLLRNELRRALTLLSASATNTNVTWDTSANKNPDQDIKTGLIAATNVTGIRPNRVIYGDTAFNKRSLSYEGASNQSTAFGQVAAMNAQQLAGRLMVDKVLVSKERYQSGANAKTEIIGSSVYAWFAEDGVDTEDPTNFKRFVTTFSGEQGGGLLRVYVQQISSKLVAITVEHYSKIVATYTGGVEKWTVS